MKKEELKDYINNNPRLSEKMERVKEAIEESTLSEKIIQSAIETRDILERSIYNEGEDPEEFIKWFEKSYPINKQLLWEFFQSSILEEIKQYMEIDIDEYISKYLNDYIDDLQEILIRFHYGMCFCYAIHVCGGDSCWQLFNIMLPNGVEEEYDEEYITFPFMNLES